MDSGSSMNPLAPSVRTWVVALWRNQPTQCNKQTDRKGRFCDLCDMHVVRCRRAELGAPFRRLGLAVSIAIMSPSRDSCCICTARLDDRGHGQGLMLIDVTCMAAGVQLIAALRNTSQHQVKGLCWWPHPGSWLPPCVPLCTALQNRSARQSRSLLPSVPAANPSSVESHPKSKQVNTQTLRNMNTMQTTHTPQPAAENGVHIHSAPCPVPCTRTTIQSSSTVLL